MAAVLVKGNRVLSFGINRYKTHPLQVSNRFTNSIHAEVDCLTKAPYDSIKGSTIYVCRRKALGELGNARPCKGCEAHLRKLGVSKVVYSGEGGEVESYKIREED